MVVNLIHRPGAGIQFDMFKLQQTYAHDLGLKVTILLQYEHLFDEKIIELVNSYSRDFGDELGIWYSDIPSKEMKKVVDRKEPFLWLYSDDDKRKILQGSIGRFKEVFGFAPISVGSYHMDTVALHHLREISPQTKITIAGCFEEGVKVFHGCNNSWYLFNEGMPFFPWYPSLHNSLVPAKNKADWEGIVAVPHLARDMVLSYEGRNDFFASHPANIQRAMANEGDNAPYTLNLFDMYRFQERYNNGFSYSNIFVGPGWLSGNPNVQDSDEITQKLYQEYLAYIAGLKAEGEVQDMYMGEFADWYKANVPVGTPQKYFAKELLYGSAKHYFWYIDSKMRVTFDMGQGGSIGDLRPFVGEKKRSTGTDSECLQMASNPYVIHSQYRSGNSYHSGDGARTTLLLEYGGQVRDLCNYPTKLKTCTQEEGSVRLVLAPIIIEFAKGEKVEIETIYCIGENGTIDITRKIVGCTIDKSSLKLTEYFKGCYGVTEYPENLKGITLRVEGNEKNSLSYQYSSESIITSNAKLVQVDIPQINAAVALKSVEVENAVATAEDGYLFSPFYTLKLQGEICRGEEFKTCLQLTKL